MAAPHDGATDIYGPNSKLSGLPARAGQPSRTHSSHLKSRNRLRRSEGIMIGRHTLRAMLLTAALASPAALHAQQQTASNDATGVEAVVVTAPHYVPDRN